MAITAAEILYKGSNRAATSGNTTANAGPGTNLGGYATLGVITDGTLNNVFTDITGDENAASAVDYQCIFVHNSNATLTLQNTVAWISSQVAGGADVAIGLDPAAPSPVGSTSPQAGNIINRQTAPPGVVFSVPTTKAGGLTVGNIPAGSVKGIWLRRTATNSTALNNDAVTVRVEGDTAA